MEADELADGGAGSTGATEGLTCAGAVSSKTSESVDSEVRLLEGVSTPVVPPPLVVTPAMVASNQPSLDSPSQSFSGPLA